MLRGVVASLAASSYGWRMMRRGSPLRGLLMIVGAAVVTRGPVWAHSVPGGPGGVGWCDDLALLTSLLSLVALLGWVTLDGRDRGGRRRP